MHRHRNSARLCNRQKLIQHPIQMLPELLGCLRSGDLLMLLIARPSPEHHGSFDILEIKRCHLGTTSLRCVEPRTGPIGTCHEVVAEQSHRVVAHRAEQVLHRTKLRSVVDPELEPLDRQVALHDPDLQPMHPGALHPLGDRTGLVTWITNHQIIHPALGRKLQVFFRNRG